MEITAELADEALKIAGEIAICDSIVLLCPVPADLCQEHSHKGVRDEVGKLAEIWRHLNHITK